MLSKKIVVVGDTHKSLEHLALSRFGSTTMVDCHNIDQAIHSMDQIYHVSLGDVPIEKFIALLKTAHLIVFQPQHAWSTSNADSYLFYQSASICRSLGHFCTVENLPDWNFVYTKTAPRPNQPVLWAFGGSYIAGVGLTDQKKNFVNLLSEKLDVGAVNCGVGGTGMRRAFEELAHTDIQKGDYVVLDPTHPGRPRVCKGTRVMDLPLEYLDKNLVLSMNDDQMFYDFVSLLDAFVKMCHYAGARLVFFCNLPYNENTTHRVMMHVSQYREFCLTEGFNIDVSIGSSNHPGPLSHKKLADYLFEHFARLYH